MILRTSWKCWLWGALINNPLLYDITLNICKLVISLLTIYYFTYFSVIFIKDSIIQYQYSVQIGIFLYSPNFFFLNTNQIVIIISYTIRLQKIVQPAYNVRYNYIDIQILTFSFQLFKSYTSNHIHRQKQTIK